MHVYRKTEHKTWPCPSGSPHPHTLFQKQPRKKVYKNILQEFFKVYSSSRALPPPACPRRRPPWALCRLQPPGAAAPTPPQTRRQTDGRCPFPERRSKGLNKLTQQINNTGVGRPWRRQAAPGPPGSVSTRAGKGRQARAHAAAPGERGTGAADASERREGRRGGGGAGWGGRGRAGRPTRPAATLPRTPAWACRAAEGRGWGRGGVPRGSGAEPGRSRHAGRRAEGGGAGARRGRGLAAGAGPRRGGRGGGGSRRRGRAGPRQLPSVSRCPARSPEDGLVEVTC